MQSEEDDINFRANDLSIEDLKQNLQDSNRILFDDLKNRFTQDLLASMIFFVFNEACRNRDQNLSEFDNGGNTPFAKTFFSLNFFG